MLDGASRPEELVTRAKELGYRALALSDHDGLILLRGCRQGQLAHFVDAGRLAGAHAVLDQYVIHYVTWFGREHVFIELQHHDVYGDTPRLRQLVQLAEEAGLPYAATGNLHYHRRDRH